MAYERVGTGATAVGIKTEEGVVLAAEKRVAYGGFVMSRGGRKVFAVKERFGLAFAGLFSDIQTLSRTMNVLIHSYELENNRPISVHSAARLLSVILYQNKWLPFISEVIFGGVDESGTHLYVMDMLGSLIEDVYAAIGSGAPIAIGIVESRYREGLKIEEAAQVAVEAVSAAIKRDALSGDGVDVVIITPKGVSEKTITLTA
ncbi:MAG: archaeal proteasome endopeptidase complex subunit beta [Zestosphaera sp.]